MRVEQKRGDNMIYFLQILKMLPKNKAYDLIALMSDLSYELEECGYEDFPEDLVEEYLMNHFNIEMQCHKQLGYLTDYIVKNQKRGFEHLKVML